MPNMKSEEGEDDMPDLKTEEGKSDPPGIKNVEGCYNPLTLPALPAPPNMFKPYLFLGQVIDANDDKDKDNMNDSEWNDSLSPKQRLRFILKKLLECNVQQALSITAQHKTILRPILLKTYWVKGELTGFRFKNGELEGFKFAKGKLTTSKLKWDERPEHYTAIAHYLFMPKENEQTCTECMNPEKYGPFAECVAGGRDGVHQGACFNCYYKGEGEGCSLRIALEGGEKRAQYPGSRVPFSRESIRNTPTDVLKKAVAMIEAELRRRREDI